MTVINTCEASEDRLDDNLLPDGGKGLVSDRMLLMYELSELVLLLRRLLGSIKFV